MLRIALTIIIFFIPIASFSDGIVIPEIVGTDIEVQATAQRAVLWQRNDTWEIHIQPLFPREKGNAAWIVPFPVLPMVELSSYDFMEELELLTSPVFIEICQSSSSGACMSATPDGNGTYDTVGGNSVVEVWERGTIGELDYVIISSNSGGDIVSWLNDEGYYVTERAELKIRTLETEGQFFFAAKLSENVDPSMPITPVRFVLPGLSPQYPLRMTSLGVAESAFLSLTLWVIFPEDSAFLPESHPYDLLDESPATPEEYDQAITKFYLTHSPDTLLLLYGQKLAYNERKDKLLCPYDYYEYPSECATYEQMGVETPETWCAEIQEIIQNRDWLFRYQARMSVSAMLRDLTFTEDGISYLPTARNTYLNNICQEDYAGMGLIVILAFSIGLSYLHKRRPFRN